MYPIVMFDSVRVVGAAENAVVFKDNNVTFRAITNMPGDYKPVYKFWAFDDMAERVKRLKIESGEWLTITAFMKERIDESNTIRHSYTIIAIDRVHGCSMMKSTEDQQKPLAPQEPEKPAQNRIVAPKGFCDLDSFQMAFGKCQNSPS